jgi:hypothetical protein
MPDFAGLAERKSELIRKAQQGSVFVAPFEADPITTLTTGAEATLEALPTGWGDLGWLTDAGIAFSEGITSSDITSWGSVYPTRSDITKEQLTAKVSAQETNARTIGVFTGADMTGVTPDEVTGEVQIASPLIPTNRLFRMLAVAVDSNDDGEIYIARFLPQVKVTDKDDQAYADAADAVLWGVTFTAYPDSVLGYATKFLWGGPGWLSLLSDMGFDDSSS